MENLKLINNLIDKLEKESSLSKDEKNKAKLNEQILGLKQIKKDITIQNILQNNLKNALSNEVLNCKKLVFNSLQNYFYKDEQLELSVVFSEIKKTYYHIKSVLPILENIVGQNFEDEIHFFKKIFSDDEDTKFIFEVYFDLAGKVVNNQTKNMWNTYKDNERIFNLLKKEK